MYASILPLLACAAFGSSMTLAVGPAAVASLMTASALSPFAAQGSPECLSLAIQLAALGGLQLMVLGPTPGVRRPPSQSLGREWLRHRLGPPEPNRPAQTAAGGPDPGPQPRSI